MTWVFMRISKLVLLKAGRRYVVTASFLLPPLTEFCIITRRVKPNQLAKILLVSEDLLTPTPLPPFAFLFQLHLPPSSLLALTTASSSGKNCPGTLTPIGPSP